MIPALNNREAYEYIAFRLDKHGTDYFTEGEVSSVFNEAYLEWLRARAKNPEGDETVTEDLLPLTRMVDIGAAKDYSLSVLDPKPFHLLAVSGIFKLEAAGIITPRRRPIRPVKWDRLSQIRQDPNHAPCDAFPLYTMQGEDMRMQVHSDTVGDQVEITYIIDPVPMDADNNPEGSIEVGKAQQMQIIEMTLRKLKITEGDTAGYQMQTNETNENK